MDFSRSSWKEFGMIVILLLLGGNAGAVPSEQWNRTFGGMGEDWISSVQQTTDDGYILAGEYIYFVGKTARGGVDTPFSGSYAWLIKTDFSGKEQWNKTFLGRLYGAAISVLQTPDGGYLFAGLTSTYATSGDNSDIWIVKVNENGTQQWNRTFGGPKYDSVNEVRLTNDNGYIIAGKYGTGENLFEAWLIRLDSNGNKLWSRTFAENEEANSIQQTLDGYIFAGRTHSYNELSSNTNAYIVKTDSNGSQQWRKIFGGKNDDAFSSIQKTQDGGFIITGFTRSFTDSRRDADAWLIKTDAEGSEQWRRTFGGTSDDMANSVQQTSDGGYIFTGNLESYGEGNADFWLVKTDPRGSQQWSRTFGGKESDRAFSVQQTRDSGYILAGLTYSYGNGSDAWLIKISGDIEPDQKAEINTTLVETSNPTPTSMATLVETLIPTDTTMTPPNRSPGFIGIYTLAEILAIMYLVRRK